MSPRQAWNILDQWLFNGEYQEEWDIVIRPSRTGNYFVEVKETADNHTVLNGGGETVEEALEKAFNDHERLLEMFGYEQREQ